MDRAWTPPPQDTEHCVAGRDGAEGYKQGAGDETSKRTEKGAEEGDGGGDKEQMKKTNIPSSMFLPSSELSAETFSGGNIPGSQA